MRHTAGNEIKTIYLHTREIVSEHISSAAKLLNVCNNSVLYENLPWLNGPN